MNRDNAFTVLSLVLLVAVALVLIAEIHYLARPAPPPVPCHPNPRSTIPCNP